MNLFLYSVEGVSGSLHQKFREEGHEAIWYIDDERSRRIGDGIFWKTDDPDSVASQADLIIFDDNGLGKKADEYRAKGYLVWGGGSFVDRLEHDRDYGMEVFNEYGIKTPETFKVASLGDVKSCLASEFGKKEKLVIKLNGGQVAGSSYSFVAKDAEECLAQVTHWLDDGLLGDGWSGIIQRFIEGIEVSCSAWWNGEEWSTHNIDLEQKKALSGDVGPAVGCAYNTIIRIDEGSKLFKLTLEPLSKLLKEQGYVGEMDTNTIVAEDGTPYALEHTPRLGWDSTPTLAWGNNHGFANKIGMILGLGPGNEFGYKGKVWGGLRVYVPPCPFECLDDKLSASVYEQALGAPILDYEKVAGDFYLYDAMRDEGGKLVCAGTTGVIGVAMGAGDDPRSAGLAAYRTASRIHIPNKSFRALDGWKRASEAWPVLQELRLVKLYPGLE